VAKNIKYHTLLHIRIKEAYLIANICLAALLMLALGSYNHNDPSWLLASHGNFKVYNLLGPVGAQLASSLFWSLGYAAYLMPLIILSISLFIYFEKETSHKQMLFWLKITGLGILLLAVAGLLNIFEPNDNYKLPTTNGGVFGTILANSLVKHLTTVGTLITLVSSAMVAVTMVSGLVWLNVIKVALKIGGRWIIRALIKCIKYIKYRYKLRNSSRDQMRKPILQASNLQAEDDELEEALLPVAAPLRRSTLPKLKVVKTLLPSIKSPAILAKGYRPTTDLLRSSANDSKTEHYTGKALQNMSAELEKTLKDFGVQAKVCGLCPGPVVTRFELELAPGVKASKVSGLAKDLARQLSVPAVRVVELIPGKPVVGLEIPNKHREVVRMRDVVESKVYQDSQAPLTLVLGKDIAGNPLIANLARMPHLLIAGSTGSGKSVGVNVMLLSLLYKATPSDVRLLLIDPKMLELAIYDGIAHLLAPVVTDMSDAAHALRWCVAEMERRYKLMSEQGVRNIDGYNEKVHSGKIAAEKLAFIVIMIDEFADLMITVGREVEDLITRITQKARAAGIHMILATQRPSVDVITGLIKANVPTRIAFQVASRIDSRTILDAQGAEQLLGNGDLLYLAPGTGISVRGHGALVEDDEVHAIVQAIKDNYGEPEYLIDLTPQDIAATESEDNLYTTAIDIVLESKKTSVSYLQRKLKIGYNRAARLIESMESAGILSQVQSNGQREIL
jgi:S-DNA-T family DNA segregation ATPase FtsK/SpoIIIE